jgi:hypothetical protein
LGPEQPQDDKADEDKKDPEGAAAGAPNGERAPVAPPTETVVPQQNPRRTSHEPAIDL